MHKVVVRFAATVVIVASCVGLAPSTAPTTGPAASPITVRHVVRADPLESMYVVSVDLTDRRVSLHVAMGGPDPDGPGPFQTTLLPTSEIAGREHWAVAVNGDFFAAQNTRDVEGRNTGFVRGKWASAVGPAVCDGRRVGVNATTRPALEVTADGRPRVATIDGGAAVPADVAQAVGGSNLLVVDGKPVRQPSKLVNVRHPRTAVGLTRDRSHLILLVVDGRRPGTSLGMTGDELAAALVDAGAYTAMNLDGGGSTTLVCRDGDHLRVVNQPSDGKERSVADALGVSFDGPVSVSP